MDEEKLLELLQRLFEKLGGSPASKAKIDDLKKETDAAKRHIKLMELVNDSFSKYNKQIKDSTKKFTDISRALSEFDDLLEQAVSDSEKL
jgi:septal ring factor EnvC (AmiA/AmiB activator)